MSKNAIILHGTCSENEYYSNQYPSLSNSHWLPWLQKQLMIDGWRADTPEIFEAYKPTYQKWLTELERYTPITKETVLVGHSCGAGFLVRYANENMKLHADKLVLVAPWFDPNREKTTDMFDFEINPEFTKRFNEVHVFISDDDSQDIQQSAQFLLAATDGIVVHRFSDLGHFCYGDMRTEEFPVLLNTIKGGKS